MRTLRGNLFYAVSTAVFVIFVCWVSFGWFGERLTVAVAAISLVAFSAFTCGCAAAAARATEGTQRLSWSVITFGFLGWVAASLARAYDEVAGPIAPPFLAVTDIGFLALPVAVAVVWVATTSVNRLATLRQLLDGAIIASSLFVVFWALVMHDLFATNDYGGIRAVLTVIHPIADMTMVTMAALSLLAAPPERRRGIAIVSAGLLCIALGDAVGLYLQTPSGHVAAGFPTIVQVAGLLTVSSAACRAMVAPAPPATAENHLTQQSLLWLPYVPIPFAVVAGTIFLWPIPEVRPILVGTVVLILAAMIHQLTVLLHNRRLLDEIAGHAFRDPLTGLANRLLFTDRLNHAIQLRNRDGRPVAVLSLDLDDFKMINDNLGHPSGDALLREIAQRLTNSVPEGDTVARFGGDEFTIIIEAGPEPPEEIARRVARAFDEPFYLDNEEVYMHPSVGLATAPEGHIAADDLLKHADVAMYAAKRSGVGTVQSFTPGMQIDRTEPQPTWGDGRLRRPPLPEVQLLGQLRRVIENGDLRLAYQPKVALATGHIVGVEALIRWPHPEFGILTPDQFMPLIRRNRLIGPVTDLVLAQAARDAAQWYRAGDRAVGVAINLFAPSFSDTALPDRIGAVLADVGLPPAAVTIEITEHYLLSNIRKAQQVIGQLRRSGLRVSIDDFGSGYATMSYLRDLPVDELKLDRHFIAPILQNKRAAAIVQSVIGLAHALGIDSVAEGVEDAATVERLREYGCDVAQGNYFAKPMFAAALHATLDGHGGGFLTPAAGAPPSGA